jgi:membrane fusion protein, multidrug efflux system
MPPLRSLARPGRNRILLAVGVALVVLVLVIARVAMHHADAADKAQAQPPAVPVVTANATKEDVPIVITGIGTVQAAQSVTVKVRVDGQLQKVAFTEGQDVKEGDLLAQIDPRPFQAALDQATAQKAHDEATLANAQKDLERYTTLFAQDSIQQQTLDTQKATVNQLKASIQSDQAQIDNAKVQLAYTTVRAPVTGRTGLRLVDAGNIVHATDTTGLVVINQIDPISVLFTLPEEQFHQVTQAMQASGRTPLTVNALARETGNTLGAGHLLLVNNQIDTQTGTFQLKASFPNRAHALWPGQYVNVHLVLGTRHDATTVPESAVQRGPEGLLAYVVKPDGSVETRSIHVANRQDGKAVVDQGLTPGTRVIVDGQYKVKPGVKVAEAKQAAPATPIAQQSEKR